jgi:UDP-glucose 4-epimerase
VRVAVTGAGGFLGQPLVEALAADMRVEDVVAIDLRPPPATDGVHPVARDVRDPAIAADLDGVDVLVHLAAVVLGRGRDAWSVSIDGSRNLLEAMRGDAIVYASSGAAYGCLPDNPVPLTEDSPLRPEPPFYYPQTKVAVEQMLDEAELRVVRMRPTAILGPGAPMLLGGRAFVTVAGFDPLMQFTWVDDAVAAFVAAIHQPVEGAFNIGAPDPVRATEIPGLLGVRHLRLPRRVLRAAARVRGMHPDWVDMARYPIVVDASRAERELGWRASSDTATALKRFAANGAVPKPATQEAPV